MTDTLGVDETFSAKLEKKKSKSIDKSVNERIENILEYYQQNDLFAGTVVVVDNRETIFDQHFGEIELPEQFHIGGLGRTYTSYLFWLEFKNDKFRYDASVSRFLDDFPFREITFGHLFEQKTGFYNAFSDDRFITSISEAEYPMDWIYRTMLRKDLIYEPGSRVEINPSTYSVMAYLAQKCTFKDYDVLVSELADKLKLNNTKLGNQKYIDDGPARFYFKNYIGCAGILSGKDDLIAWAQYHNTSWQKDHNAFKEYFSVTAALDSLTQMTRCWLKDEGKISELGNSYFYAEGNDRDSQILLMIEPIDDRVILLISQQDRFPAYKIASDIIEVLN